MSSKRKKAESSKGKEKEKAPSELPEDLPENCPYNRRNPESALFKVKEQGSQGYCWTIQFTRMISCHLFIHKKTKTLLSLSAKHLFANTSKKHPNGNLKSYEEVKGFFKNDGLILEGECKCIADQLSSNNTACLKVKDNIHFKIDEFVVEEIEIDEKKIISLLQTGSIAAEIKVTKTYRNSKGKVDVYYGPKKTDKVENHIVLITGIGTKNGVHYFEFQNTWGPDWGENGCGKLARKVSLQRQPSLILSYMYPKLLDQVFEVKG